MNYKEKKDAIYCQVKELEEKLDEILPSSSQHKPIADLLEDIRHDYYNIVVLGEFKHGKSTFVNALLNRDIMPRDVTPTTATINAAFYSETEELHVVKVDGKVDSYPLHKENLNPYTVTGGGNVSDVKYVKLFLPSPLLKDRVVLVDTPGVNDLNEQRGQITHQFIPRADVVLFLTSITNALKKTEQHFIQEQLKESGMDKAIFVANFIDRVDEDEYEDVMDFAARRLQSITGRNDAELFPLSAKEALEGKLSGDEELVAYSGIAAIEEAIREKIHNGARGVEKLRNFEDRLYAIAQVVVEEINTANQLQAESKEELEDKLASINEWLESQSQLEQQLKDYVRERESEIRYMVERSVNHFGNKLQEDIQNRIMVYQGADIKALVDSQLPITIRTQFNNWVEQYGDHINDLLVRLKQEIIKGLSNSFKQKVQMNARRIRGIEYEANLPILNYKSGNANVKAGALMGGVSTVALLLGGGFFIPVVGMAGMPFISQKIAEKQLENVKPELVNGVRSQIDILIEELHQSVDVYVHQQVREIRELSLEEFAKLLQSFQSMVNVQIDAKLAEASRIEDNQVSLGELKQLVEEEILKEEVVV